MPPTTEPPKRPSPPEQPSLRRRLTWFFGIAAVSGLAFAGAAELLRWLLLH
jgi:hypothetical protein